MQEPCTSLSNSLWFLWKSSRNTAKFRWLVQFSFKLLLIWQCHSILLLSLFSSSVKKCLVVICFLCIVHLVHNELGNCGSRYTDYLISLATLFWKHVLKGLHYLCWHGYMYMWSLFHCSWDKLFTLELLWTLERGSFCERSRIYILNPVPAWKVHFEMGFFP